MNDLNFTEPLAQGGIMLTTHNLDFKEFLSRIYPIFSCLVKTSGNKTGKYPTKTLF